jgi:hypothetical protein
VFEGASDANGECLGGKFREANCGLCHVGAVTCLHNGMYFKAFVIFCLAETEKEGHQNEGELLILAGGWT